MCFKFCFSKAQRPLFLQGTLFFIKLPACTGGFRCSWFFEKAKGIAAINLPLPFATAGSTPITVYPETVLTGLYSVEKIAAREYDL
jgi:hypothetical protein